MHRLAVIMLTLATPLAAAAQAASAGGTESADIAWDRGDYPAALEQYARLLRSPNAERYRRSIAVMTGELYRVTEVAPDGRLVRFSPDGHLAAYETGSGPARTTHVVALDGKQPARAFAGGGLVFSPSGTAVAYRRVAATDDLARARAELDRLTRAQDRRAVAAQLQTVAWLEGRDSRIVLRDLASGTERELASGGLLVGQLAFSPDGRAVYFVGARGTDDGTTDIFAVGDGAGAPRALTSGPSVKTDPLVTPDGLLVHTIGGRNPLARPTAGAPAPAPYSAPAPGVGRFAVLQVATGEVRQFDGGSVAVAADGSALVFLARAGDETSVNVLDLRGRRDPVTVQRTAMRVDAPALSADGRTIAYMAMPKDDWEIYVVGADGRGERRVTREIQHDLYPRFLRDGRLLAVIGEGRHRRSYLYDVTSGARTRLFHNNTVRTIAPEYEWAVSPDGSKALVVAERDGDTISPERGVYLADLTAEVTVAELEGRVRRSLEAERELRARGRRSFAPVDGVVRRAVADVSITRIYGYEKALASFDSRHITRPGNRAAAEYLFKTFEEMGYTPSYQWFEPPGLARTANVVATLKGTEHPELVYVVSAHYDAVAAGPGADDDATGTAVLLETARVLAKHPLPATVIFAAFTGEESGLLGSREFVRRAVADSLKVVGALNNDMLGWANDHRLDNTIRYSNAGIRDMQHAAAFLYSRLITYDAKYYKSTDAAAYYEAYGDIVGGIGSYPVLGSPHYHQSHDVLETINHELVTETTKATLASLMLLASSPSRIAGLTVASHEGSAAVLRWTPSPENGVSGYLVAYGPPSDPMRHTVRVRAASARLANAPVGTMVAVKAVTSRGIEGWDWARTTVGGETAGGQTPADPTRPPR